MELDNLEEILEYSLEREKRNPASIGMSVLSLADKTFCEIAGEAEGYFVKSFLINWFSDETVSGDQLLDQYEDIFNDGGYIESSVFFLLVASRYAVQSIKAYTKANSESEQLAWTFAVDANYWLGVALGDHVKKHEHKSIQRERSEKAAAVRHAENRALKEYALEYYAANKDKFTTMDEAALQIAGKIVPTKFRAVRDWITEYHKKLRSAGTE